MKPVNEKSLLHHLFNQMDMLEKGEVGIDQAVAQAKLANEASKLFKQEMDRARLIMDLQIHEERSGERLMIRELASKGFDDTTNVIDRTEL